MIHLNVPADFFDNLAKHDEHRHPRNVGGKFTPSEAEKWRNAPNTPEDREKFGKALDGAGHGHLVMLPPFWAGATKSRGYSAVCVEKDGKKSYHVYDEKGKRVVALSAARLNDLVARPVDPKYAHLVPPDHRR